MVFLPGERRVKLGKFVPVKILGEIKPVGDVDYGSLREVVRKKREEQQGG